MLCKSEQNPSRLDEDRERSRQLLGLPWDDLHTTDGRSIQVDVMNMRGATLGETTLLLTQLLFC